MIKERLVEFTQLAMANAEGSDDMLNRVMTKDNIGLAALLETREGAWDTRECYSISFKIELFLSNVSFHLNARLAFKGWLISH